MLNIRSANPDDLDALYHITVKTGDMGSDASHLCSDNKMLGHIYSAPYLNYEPELTFVAERNATVLGYCVGTLDTYKFEALLESNWWPPLRLKYQKPDEKTRTSWSPGEHISWMIHHPEPTPHHIANRFPAHLHMNLLPEAQGEGVGTMLLERWFQKAAQLGATAAHIGADPQNKRAIQFWNKQGFEFLEEVTETPTIWMGRQLP